MIPKKANKLYKVTAEELNISETLLEDLVEFAYKDLRKNLTELTYPRINVDGLGVFVTKNFMIKKYLENVTKKISGHDVSTFSAYYNKKILESKVSLLEKLMEKILEEEQEKENFILKKNENKS